MELFAYAIMYIFIVFDIYIGIKAIIDHITINKEIRKNKDN